MIYVTNQPLRCSSRLIKKYVHPSLGVLSFKAESPQLTSLQDFFYICALHLKDKYFATPKIDEEAAKAKREKELAEETEKLKREYEEKQRKKKDKDAKDKDKGKDKKDKKDDEDKGKESDKDEDKGDEKEKDKGDSSKEVCPINSCGLANIMLTAWFSPNRDLLLQAKNRAFLS